MANHKATSELASEYFGAVPGTPDNPYLHQLPAAADAAGVELEEPGIATHGLYFVVGDSAFRVFRCVRCEIMTLSESAI